MSFRSSQERWKDPTTSTLAFLRLAVVFCAALMLPGLRAAVNYEVLASFEKPGTQVVAPLMRHSGGDFFGVASAGGAAGKGSVFKVTPAGVISTLFAFSGPDGQAPAAALVEGADGALYGTTSSGGSGNFGVVFKITTNGDYTKLVDFTGISGAARGSVPHGLMLHADGNFYGVAQGGGTGLSGTVFQMTPTGELTTLADLTGTTGANLGSEPLGPLAVSGSLLYGVTKYGGAAGLGVIFEISTAGVWRTLGEFTGVAGVRPGANSAGTLLMHSDGALYGTTEYGGTNDFGALFKITTAATPVYTVLRHFADPTGSQPSGRLILGADGLIYGTTAYGGTSGWGTAYKIATTTGTHTLLTSFTGEAGVVPGASPRGGFAVGVDGLFYSVTSAGAAGNYGAAFKVASSGAFTSLAAISLPMGWMPSGAPVVSGSSFLFPMAAGGTGGGGNVMSVDTAGTVSVASALGGTLGTLPDGALRSGAGGVFYGLTAKGGASSRGTTYRYTPGTGTTLLVAHTTTAGSLAEGPLVLGADGLYYGLGREGGASTRGAIFKVTTAGVRTRVTSFTGTAGLAPGGKPRGPLVLAGDGNFYGLTEDGGTSNTGVLFKLTAAGVYSVITHFGTTGARSPLGGLVLGSDGALYGTTSLGGIANAGTLIRFDPTTATWSIVGEFTGTSGAVPGRLPSGELHVAADGTIYGLTQAGGAGDLGTLFRYTQASGLESIVAFTGAAGAAPGSATANDGAGLAFTGGVISAAAGTLYGVLPGSGANGGGVAFRVTITTGTPIDDWKFTFLGDANALDEDDFDFDGLPNLLEYALGSLPAFPGVEAVPQGTLVSYPDGDRLTLEVLRDPARSDITLIVEVSATLMPNDWTTLATSTLGAPFTGPGYWDGDSATPSARYVTIRDIVPIAPDLHRFIRLRVVH
ncbi:MAG: choice-of-anchor tandem repeat GloVer-containing protein [Prosthecobacter sp.]